MPSGAVPHYQPCLLVCCLTLGHAFWCGASSSTMPVGVVPHYRPCLLAWYFTMGHAFWLIATAINILLVECRWKKGGYKSGCYLYSGAIISDMSNDPVPHSDMPACTMQLYQTCMLCSWIDLRMFVKCCSTKQGIWSFINPPDMPTVRMPLSHDC